jgi:hypothetical protein
MYKNENKIIEGLKIYKRHIYKTKGNTELILNLLKKNKS